MTPGSPSKAVSSHQKQPPAKIAVERSGGAAKARLTTAASIRETRTPVLNGPSFSPTGTTPARNLRFQSKYGGYSRPDSSGFGGRTCAFPISYDEPAAGRDLDDAELVEALFPGGRLQALEGPADPGRRDHTLGRPLPVAPDRVAQRRSEV